MLKKFAEQWQAVAWRALVKGVGEAARIDEAELFDLFAGRVVGVDTGASPRQDATEVGEGLADFVTPLERLEESVGVARDFRAAGTGAEWDRVREYDPKVYGWPKDKSRGQSLGTREWTSIDTIVLHTAAARLHEDRFLGVPCHLAVADSGGVVLCHYLDAYLAHGHRLNSFSIGIEISGDRTIANGQIIPAREVVRYAVEELRRKHAEVGASMPIKISPHRHGHSSRVNDCDLVIWRAVAEWAIDELGLELGRVVGSGTEIPSGWWSPGRPERSAA